MLALFSYHSGNAQNQCVHFFQKDSLQAPSMEWVKEQRSKAVVYTRNSKVGKSIAALLLAEGKLGNDLIEPLETDNFSIRIIDKGLEPRTPVDVVYFDKKTSQSVVLLSSLKRDKEMKSDATDNPTITKFASNNTVIPVKAQLSPLKDYLLVKVSSKGNIDVFTLVIIDLKSKKIISEIEGVSDSKTVWITPRQFSYKERTLNRDIVLVSISENNQITTQVTNDRRVSGSSDQQWYYAEKSSGEYLIASTIRRYGFNIEIKSRIESIFKSSQDTLWIKTYGDSDFYEILKIQLKNIDSENPNISVIKAVPESKMVIQDVKVKNDYIVVSKYLGKHRVVEIRDLNGQPIKSLKIPDCCGYSGVSFDSATGDIMITLLSPVLEQQPWVFNVQSKKWLLLNEDNARIEKNPEAFMLKEKSNTGDFEYVVEYKSYRSKDGTEIPMRLTYKKDLVFNGDTPTLMEFYGGFGSNAYFHPEYERMTHEFIKAGGVHAVPAIRGSYYFGQKWHDQGRVLNKQNVFDDAIGAAEWLVQNKITQPKKIAISGDSHGGLVVGALITQRPDLFGLAFPRFGALVFHEKSRLDPLTTPFQVYEYGDLINDPLAIENARKISPELNLRKTVYPMTVIITGRNDSRVNPEHSYLFAKKMLEAQQGNQPIFLYTNTNSGHFSAIVELQDFLGWRTKADYWTFIFEYFQLKLQ